MLKTRKILWPVLVLTALATPVSAADANNIFGIKMLESLDDLDAVAYEDPQAHFTFGKTLSGYFFQDLQRYDDPRLGYSLTYAIPNGSHISVYVYDLGMDNLPDGLGSKPVVDELAQSAQAVSASGQYAQVQQREAPALSPHFAQVAHDLIAKSGQPLLSYTLLRAQNGFFVKVRITDTSRGVDKKTADFLTYLVEDLGIESRAETP